jgi:phosphoribosylformimino-5-aminoimidazole carboxamide ribotide isomerase
VRDGFSWLHVVDLNGAIEGKSVNTAAVQSILESISIPVQLGGGIRTLEGIEAWIEAGVSASSSAPSPCMIPTWSARPPACGPSRSPWPSTCATARWRSTAGPACRTLAIDLSRRFEDAGVAALIITDISRDGALTGVNVEGVGELADAVSIPVIASGGVASVADIERLKARPGVEDRRRHPGSLALCRHDPSRPKP